MGRGRRSLLLLLGLLGLAAAQQLVLPLRRKLRPEGEAFLASFQDAGNEAEEGGTANGGRGLRGKKRRGGGFTNSTTVVLDGLAMGAIYGYFAVLKFDGNQEMELLVDTGSSDLLVASTLCKACDEVTVSRSHKNDPVRPLLDLERARALGVPCDHELCVGPCTEQHLKRVGIADQTFCGPRGGTCIRTPQQQDAQGMISSPCMFLNAFMDASYDYGVLVRGPVGMGSLEPVNMTYGAIVGGQDRIVKLPRGGGVLGMAPSACAADTHLSCFPSFIDALKAEKHITRLVSICGNEENPVMVVGGTDPRLRAPNSQVMYTPMGNTAGAYDITIDGVKLGEQLLLPMPGAGAIAHVDTGTSFCYVPQAVFAAFKAALQTERYCSALPGVCPTAADPTSIFDAGVGFPFTHAEVREAFPTLSFTAPGNVTLSLTGSDYLLPAKAIDATSAYFVLVLNATDDGTFLVGQTMLQRLYTEYDADQRRVGFAPAAADCRKAVGL